MGFLVYASELLATRITSVPSLAYHLRLSNLIAVPQLSEFYAYEDTFIYDDMVFEILKPYSHSWYIFGSSFCGIWEYYCFENQVLFSNDYSTIRR